MVRKYDAWFHDGLSVTLKHPGTGERFRSYTKWDVLDNVRIRWGRESLFSAPSRRTMTFTVRVNEAIDTFKLWYWRALRVEADAGGTLLFRGQIDAIKLIRETDWGDVYQFSATEAPRWNDWLRETHSYNQLTIDWARTLAAREGYTVEPLPEPVYPLPRYLGKDMAEFGVDGYELTGEQVLRIAAAPYPASFVQWNPNGTVSSTMVRNKANDKRLIMHSQLDCSPFEVRLEDTPFRVAMQSEQAWAPKLPRAVAFFHDEAMRFQYAKVPNFKNWGPFIRLDNGINFNYLDSRDSLYLGHELRPESNSFYWAADMIRGQITSPKKMKFYDTLLGPDPGHRWYFDTWEKHENLEIYDVAPPNNGPYRIIGGTLTITHGLTTHEVTAVWARSHPEWGYPQASDLEFINGDNLGSDKEYLPF